MAIPYLRVVTGRSRLGISDADAVSHVHGDRIAGETMADTVSDFLIKRLHEWGVRHIFGYPGDGINGIMGALNRAEKDGLDMAFIQSRHEELSAFMACGAKFTGEVGVCLATSGPRHSLAKWFVRREARSPACCRHRR